MVNIFSLSGGIISAYMQHIDSKWTYPMIKMGLTYSKGSLKAAIKMLAMKHSLEETGDKQVAWMTYWIVEFAITYNCKAVLVGTGPLVVRQISIQKKGREELGRNTPVPATHSIMSAYLGSMT